MFMAYLVIATFCFCLLGYEQVLQALGVSYNQQWPFFVPQVIFILIYVLCVVLCLAVTIMLTWHLWGVVKGETSVEGQDHDIYRNVAQRRGDTFVNSYDLGKLKNLQLFFNVGPTG
ncbi:hypothetical protein HWV62_34191 [Athelia sp. TMB]|nr:hypothetical protein HWV62_16496 [Athelia sp. TMB]KAF7981284.1 hypothetical protein HWV62_34191 [Athelia sp. TMB]